MFRFVFFVVILLSLPTITNASSVLRTGDSINVASDQAVEGDFYSLGNTVVVSGEVTEDLLTAGGAVTINGSVGADFAALAGTVDVGGVIGDDARIIAGEVTVTGEIIGDLVVLAGKLKVLSTAKITGDILFFGTEAEISGEVGKSVFGTSESIRIDGKVGGDIDITTKSLTLGDRTNIEGMVKYTSAVELIRSQNARVAGKVLRNDPVLVEVGGLKTIIIPLLILLFATLVWYLLFRRLLEKVSWQATTYPLRSMLIGFGLFFLIPIAVGILIASTLGSLLGISLLFIYFAILLVTLTILGVVAGAYLMKLTPNQKVISVPVIMIGTVIAFSLVFVPFVGPIILLALMLITLGSLATHLYRTIRSS